MEADQRLYVRPLLEARHLLLLHARHCSEVLSTGAGLGKVAAPQERLAEIFGVSQQRVAAMDKQLREAKAIDKDRLVTPTIGRVAVSIVQYCHHTWADEQFGELVTEATEQAEMRLKHPDRELLQPKLYLLVKKSLKGLDEKLGPDARRLRALLAIYAHITKREESSRARDLSVEMGIPSRTLQEQIRGIRERGWMTPAGFVLTTAGQQEAEKAASIATNWTRETRLAMASWTSD